jgi:hypothetical protein
VEAIRFADLAAYARRQEDGIGPLLAEYLARWQAPAGAVDPWG